MNTRPLFNSITAAELDAYGRNMSHALLLFGDEGVGLETAALRLVEVAGAISVTVLPEHKDVVDIERGRITITVIRRLYDLVRTKSDTRRCVIVTAADTITTEAQHAFLKLLEEPSFNTSFILLCHNPQRLLATVTSRVQQVRIRRIDRHQSEILLDSLKVTDPTTRSQLLFIAEGLPGRLTTLANHPDLLEVEATQLRQARTIIQGTAYERMKTIQGLKDDRIKALKTVAYMIALLRREIIGTQAASSATLKLLEQLETAQTRLEANGNVRITLAAAIL